MKTLQIFTIFLTSMILISCGSNTESGTSNQVVDRFLDDIHSLEKVVEPILSFQKVAEKSADKIISLDKVNIKDVFLEAKSYAHCVIVTGNHTIVIIDDLEDCKQSGSWGACMPMAKGFIKKGDLVYQEDYVNNIIGRPDSQKRTVYLFEFILQ